MRSFFAMTIPDHMSIRNNWKMLDEKLSAHIA